MPPSSFCLFFCFVFNDTPTTEIYTLSLHDALPISFARCISTPAMPTFFSTTARTSCSMLKKMRSEEHTSELQSHSDLVCRLLLEKKNWSTLALHSVYSR